MQPHALQPPPAVADMVGHRLVSRLLDGLGDWWQPPALAAGALLAAAAALWLVRRDAVELPRPLAAVIAALRLTSLAAVAAAILDVQRITEHEITLPSRVAVLVDTSASMAVAEGDDGTATRLGDAAAFVGGELLAGIGRGHELTVWRFDADAEPVTRIPAGVDGEGAAIDGPLDSLLAPRGAETRIGDAVLKVVEEGAAGTLAGVVVVSDGGNNAGVDPGSAADAVARTGVPVHVIGVGRDTPPANVRVADVAAPARVVPGDRFAVSGLLQATGMSGSVVRVELEERAEDSTPAGGAVRTLDTVDVVLGGDGELVSVRFDVPGLAVPGRRTLVVRALPEPGDRSSADDSDAVDVEVVDRVTQVLLMAGGPGREYQFMRNVLARDRSFAVDVLLGTASAGIVQEARRILEAFPADDAALAGYDAVVAIDHDWRTLDQAAQARLERWVARESGGLMIVAGGVFTGAWVDDARSATLRGLHPLELRRGAAPAAVRDGSTEEPRRLELTPDGVEAEFLRLAGTPAASAAVWREFAGVHSCWPGSGVKPGATVYARLAGDGAEGPVYLAGQFYGSGTVLAVGSGELWRLRAMGDAAHERLVPQLLRHVSQGRLLRGARRGRLVVEQDRVPVGGTVRFRIVGDVAGTLPACAVVAPDGGRLPVPLAADPARAGTASGSFVAAREGSWLIEADPLVAGDEPLSRRIQARLPDRELASPRLDRGPLLRLATATGGTAAFLVDGAAARGIADSIGGSLPDRSRREYETGAADAAFAARLNAALLGTAASCLCLEWIVRRLWRLA